MLLAKRCKMILLVEKVPLKQLLFLVPADPVNGITWHSSKSDPETAFGLCRTLIALPQCCHPGGPEFCLCLLRRIAQVLWYYFETVVREEKENTSCST